MIQMTPPFEDGVSIVIQKRILIMIWMGFHPVFILHRIARILKNNLR
jgi:hypothetical protein